MKTILHIDFNSYFASVEQQANPRLQGKPIGVTGGDRISRTVLSTASIEAKKLGVKTGMQIWEAKKICPQLIIVCSDHDKYLSVTTKFLNILKDYSPNLEIFSIDEAFLELPPTCRWGQAVYIAEQVKQRIKSEVGERITCSIGISYNKLMAKLAGSLQKPDGLVVIPDCQTAIKVLDSVELDDVCGIGLRIKRRLFNMGITNFITLRKVPKELLVASFKSYGEVLYNMARGIDHTPVLPFYEKEEVKSIGHQYTLERDINDPRQLKQILLKISEMVASRLRAKKLAGKTIHLWFRYALSSEHLSGVQRFEGDGMQKTLACPSQDGQDFFNLAWEMLNNLWDGRKIRLLAISVSNLRSQIPANISLLPEQQRKETINQILDKVNNKFGEFTLERGALLNSTSIKRKPNPFLSDRRFKI